MDFRLTSDEMKLSAAARDRLRKAVEAEFGTGVPESSAKSFSFGALFKVKIPVYQAVAALAALALAATLWSRPAARPAAHSTDTANTKTVSTVDGAGDGAQNVNFL